MGRAEKGDGRKGMDDGEKKQAKRGWMMNLMVETL